MGHSLEVVGKAGHSSDPAKGINAIEIVYEAIGALLDLKRQLQQSEQDSHFTVPHSTLNLGHIHGGDGENRICGHCKLNFDLRAVPALTDEDAIARIDAALQPVSQKYPGRLSRNLMYPTAPAFSCRDEHGIVELAEQLTGFSVTSANYATEGPFINALGCDTLILGPGSINQAHQPDEFISLSYVDPTVKLLRNMIKAVCF